MPITFLTIQEVIFTLIPKVTQDGSLKKSETGVQTRLKHFSDVPIDSELLCIGDIAKTTKTNQLSPRIIKKMILLVSVGGHFMIGTEILKVTQEHHGKNSKRVVSTRSMAHKKTNSFSTPFYNF